MALVTRKCLLKISSPLIQATRLRGKINIQKPKPPHFDKANFLSFTQPKYINPKKDKHPAELCRKDVNFWAKSTENPFQAILAREFYNKLETSRLVAFFHMNPFSADDRFKAFVQYKKQNMLMKSYGKKLVEMAVKGTPYETILELYVSRNMMVFSPEPEIKKLLRVAKKFPQLILLAGIFEGKLLSKDEIMKFNAIPNIQTAQTELVQTLNNLSSSLVQQLNTHQNSLVNNLEQHIKQLKDS